MTESRIKHFNSIEGYNERKSELLSNVLRAWTFPCAIRRSDWSAN